MRNGKNVKQYHFVQFYILLFFMLIMAVVVVMNFKNSANLRDILSESVKAQLISTSLAAREILDVDAFISYQDKAANELPAYQQVLAKLRSLADSVGAKYIYALKRQGDKHVFVFDTDTENSTIFEAYDISAVHKAAFSGHNAADIMNVQDEFGSFNTGAAPIMHNGVVAGIISTDISDAYIQSSYNTALRNSIMLIAILLLTMGVMFIVATRQLERLRHMQENLRQQALYDNITGLPNRQYLMEHLARITSAATPAPFALFFIDLDNFKKVNDNAGHDAGDELLRQIGHYLDSTLTDGKSFRPSAGQLNIAARVGGDEFIQVVNGLDTAQKAARAAGRLLNGFKAANLSRYIDKYNVGLSIGVALYPHDTDNFHVLIKYADIAMYHAKRGGKNQYCIYADEMGQEK